MKWSSLLEKICTDKWKQRLATWLIHYWPGGWKSTDDRWGSVMLSPRVGQLGLGRRLEDAIATWGERRWKIVRCPWRPELAVGRPASRLSSWQTTDCPPAPSLIGLSRNHLRQAQQTDSCFCKCQMDALDAVVTCHLNHSSRKYLLSGPSPIIVYPCNSLTDSLLFSKLDWCDPGLWRCQLKTCWCCNCWQNLFHISKLRFGKKN